MKIKRAALPIKADGIYAAIELKAYHSSAAVPEGDYAVSSSDLRTAWSMSMAHAYDRWAHNPGRAETTVTKPMLLGTAAHHLLLGEDHWNTKFIQQPLEYPDGKTGELKPWHNGSNYCKSWQTQQYIANRTVVTHDDLDTILGMAGSLALEPIVKDGLLEGAVECSGFCKDKETGLWIKVRPDVIPNTGGDFVDLKTIADITDRGIKRRIREAGYHQQGALVWQWCDALDLEFETFTLAFIETSRPYCARMVPLHDDDIAYGRRQNRLMLRAFADCINRGHWPGPGEGNLDELRLPKEERDYLDVRLAEAELSGV